MGNEILNKIHQHLRLTDNVAVIPHQNPDGDALGSASALMEYLKLNNKNTRLFCATSIPEQWYFLPHINHNAQLLSPATAIKNEQQTAAGPDAWPLEKFSTIVVLDTGDLRYAGIHHLTFDPTVTIINIDHHLTNDNYGHLNFVNPLACSTAEALYSFFKHNRVMVNNKMSTALLTGIMTDTNNFTNAATTAGAINMAGELLRAGANVAQIQKRAIKNTTFNLLRVWGLALNRLEKIDELNLAYTYLTQNDYQKHQIEEREVEGLSNFLNQLAETKVAVFMRETDDKKIKVSMRATADDIDLSALAKKMGGGGHKKAAGFTAEGSVEEVIKKILTIIRDVV